MLFKVRHAFAVRHPFAVRHNFAARNTIAATHPFAVRHAIAATHALAALLVAGCVALASTAARSAPADTPLGLPPDLSSDAEAQGFADLLFANGMAALARKDYAGARPYFEKAAATWPKDSTFAYFSAIARLRLAASAEGAGRGDLGAVVTALRRTLPPASNRVPESRVRCDLGEALYLLDDLPGAEKELRSSLGMDEGDGWTHFYLGLTLFGLGREQEAMPHLERAVAVEPALAANGAFYLGVGSYRAGDTTAARRQFEAAVRGAPGADTGASAQQWLTSLEPGLPAVGGGPPLWEARAGIGYERDDNPLQLTELFGFSGGTIESDTRRVGQLRAAWTPFQWTNGWKAGFVVNGYASRHARFDEADLEGGQFVAQAIWGADPVGYVNGPLGFARTSTGEDRFGVLIQAGASHFDRDTDPFRRDYEVAASFLVREHGLGKSQLELHYDDQTYFQNPLFELLNGHTVNIRLGQYFTLGKTPDRYLRLAVSGGRITAREKFLGGTGSEESLSRDTSQLLGELALPAGGRCIVFLNGAITHEDYRDSTDFDEADRTDSGVSVLVTIAPHLYATARYARTKRDVTPPASSYDRKVLSLGLTTSW